MADAPDVLFSCAALTMGARCLGALLWRYAQHGEEFPFVWPATATLAEQLNADARVVRRLLEELREHSFAIEQKRTIGGRVMRGWMLLRPGADVSYTDTGVREADAGVLLGGHGGPGGGGHGRPQSGHGGPGGRTPASGKADAGVLRIPIESPLNPKRESALAPVSEQPAEPEPTERVGGGTWVRVKAGRQGGWQAGKPCTVDELLSEPFGEKLQREHGCLDGKSGRPTLRATLVAVCGVGADGRFSDEGAFARWTWPQPAASKLEVYIAERAQKHRYAWERERGAVPTASDEAAAKRAKENTAKITRQYEEPPPVTQQGPVEEGFVMALARKQQPKGSP